MRTTITIDLNKLRLTEIIAALENGGVENHPGKLLSAHYVGFIKNHSLTDHAYEVAYVGDDNHLHIANIFVWRRATSGLVVARFMKLR